MASNKDEATRTMEIALQKFNEKDFAGAKFYACQAKSMYHDLEGVDKMISIFDVHLARAQNDPYKILSVDRSADPSALKKSYMKLALQLHPDKNNNLVGATDAFVFLKDAYDMLSQEAESNLKHHTTSTGAFQQNTSNAPPAPSSGSGSYDFATDVASEPGKKKGTGATKSAASDPPMESHGGVKKSTSGASNPSSSVGGKKQKSSGPSGTPPVYRHASVHRTFWTSCDKCNGKFKYPTVYRDHVLECHICHQPYQTTEIPGRPVMD